MEVFLSNVPLSLTDGNLQTELKPLLNALGIVDWVVDKPKRKPVAWISFLKASDGVKFLKKHGKVSAPQRQTQVSAASPSPGDGHSAPPRDRTPAVARLLLLSTPIYVEKSRRKVNPQTLGHLRHEAKERQTKPDRGQRASAIICRLRQLSSGKIIFAQPRMELKYMQQTHHQISGHATFGLQSLVVNSGQSIRMDVPYHTIQELVLDRGSQSITLILEDPPKFFAEITGSSGDSRRWERQTSFPSWAGHSKYVAHCLVYQLTLSGDYDEAVRALRLRDILPLNYYSIPLKSLLQPIEEDYTTGMRAFEGKIQSLGSNRKPMVPFPILFQVQTLVWNNYLHPYSGIRVLEILERRTSNSTWKGETPLFTVDAMKRLLQRVPYPVPGTDPTEVDPDALVESVVRAEIDLRNQDSSRSGLYGPTLPRHQTWVFKAMVTPTRVFLQGPDAESRNRVLRMFPDRDDMFLRVSFCDEDGQDLTFSPKVSNDTVYKRYREVLVDGIRIAGRQFSFLGFSHSSLRSHSTWFMAPFVAANGQLQSRNTILAVLGDFSDIRVPAKCAARIGQAFSETPYAVDLFKANIHVRYIPDVKSPDGKRVFSDGVGTISWGAMQELWDALPKRSVDATCFQIRWAGVKGLLVFDPTLQGKVICVRKESMMKFPSRDLRELGICDVASRPLRLVLNRQMIKILEDMETNDSWFLALQNDALEFLRGVTATALNTSTFLQYQDIGNAINLASFIKQLDKMDIDYRCDAFLKSVVEHVVLRELRLLKHKARIPVPKGVTLFGVMDETGFLKEKEVYVCFDERRGKSGELMDATLTDGPIIVTRSPALHPGDIQYVKMVRPPQSHPLRRLRNCIVFSQKGIRDLPSQLSGGDLDGDLYNVIWDPRARPGRVYEAADYARVVAPSLIRAVTRHDIADFFIDFMKSDILGLIAIRHQILADVQDEGTADLECIKLAELHSTAVDYSKTGIAVDWREMPRAPRSRPDFLAPAPPLHVYDLGQISHIAEEDDYEDVNGMGIVKQRYHESQKILGRLYRGIDEKKIWKEDIHRPTTTDGPSVWAQLMGRVRTDMRSFGIRTYYSHHFKQALKIRALYEDSIADSMWHFSDNPRNCISEAEAFCGSILNKKGVQSRQQRETSIQLKEESDRVMTWITKLMRDGIDQGDEAAASFGDEGDDDSPNEHKAIRLSWACLVVGCIKAGEGVKSTNRGTGELQSFRVIAAACLVKELNSLRSRRLQEEIYDDKIKNSKRQRGA